MRHAWGEFLATGAHPWLWRVVGHPELTLSLEEVERWGVGRLCEALAWCDLREVIAMEQRDAANNK